MSSSKRNQDRGGGIAAGRRYERLRGELAGYAEGVHRMGEPAPASALAVLPDDPDVRELYASWNGGELFIDALVLRPADAWEPEDEGEGEGSGPARGLVWFADSALGDRFARAADGRIWRLEEDSGELLVEATSFARFVEGWVVAEGTYYDREGDFLEEAFGEAGDELAPAAIARREKKALRLDPDAPAPAWRLARALERLGDATGAKKTLEGLVAREPGFAWAWFDLGRLLAAAGDAEAAEAAFETAARAGAEGGHEQAGWFAAHAARVAAGRGDEASRARHAARALELDAEVARAQRKAAKARVDEGRYDDARELLAVAAALAPRDLEVAELTRRLAAHAPARPAKPPAARPPAAKPPAARPPAKPR